MNWKKINRNKRIQHNGKYPDWKQQISDDCFNQCVYCSIHENPWGGIDHFHIEHYRPKSKFKDLEDDIKNLYHSCPVCNRFKSDDWPNEPDLNIVSYPDPSDYDYTELFDLDKNNFNITGRYTSSIYLVNRLYLNRPQLIYERREQYLKIKAELLIEEIRKSIILIDDSKLKNKVINSIIDLMQHLNVRGNIPPYKLVEIRK